MKGRMQKTSTQSDNCPLKDRTASESYAGVQTFMGITENNLIEVRFGGDDLMERIVSPPNLDRAYKQVMSNRGSGGIDRMQTGELLPWLHRHKESLLNSLLEGTYRPCPVRRVEIPKGNGQTRPLGIPTVVDRLVQQAIPQILSPLYEAEFSETSYGFRPGRGCHDALRKAQSHINSGYKYAVDLDLEKFFDTVNHSRLIEVLSHKIRDGRVISLIHKYLVAGVRIGERFEESHAGVPQGGPLSSLLGNIMLDGLDRELERRGHPFVRYADDCMIFCRSRRAAERTRDSIIRFIEEELYLRVNREKTKAGHIRGMKFLGYSFYIHSGEYRLSVHPKSLDKFKAKLKELTGRSNGMGYARRKESLRHYIMGWLEYFKLADMKSKLHEMDRWFRRRLRMCIWKNWKKTVTRTQESC